MYENGWMKVYDLDSAMKKVEEIRKKHEVEAEKKAETGEKLKNG